MQFTVENLGKVSKADIDLKPLTIFIGKNGSGKTYVASALWAYVTYIKSIANDVESFIPKDIFNKYHDKIAETISKIEFRSSDTDWLKIDNQDLAEITDYVLKKIQTSSILKDCFIHNFFENSLLNFSLSKLPNLEYCFSVETSRHSYGTSIENDDEEEEVTKTLYFYLQNADNDIFLYEDSWDFDNVFDGEEYIGFDDINHINQILFYQIIEQIIFGSFHNNLNQLVYIPAARTGLMFGLHNFANTSLEQQNHFGVKKNIENQYDLTAPLNDFISKLYKETISPYRPFGVHRISENKLSDNLIDGKITVNRQDKRFKYVPKSLNQELPLSASSSLVTETAVLSIFNSSIRKGSFVIFEEPEAHLHLSAQREMAKLIVKMINQGCHMLITTHSDTFLQQLNNLIMLNKLSENNPDILQEFNIEQDETIAGEKVAVYDFQYQDDDKTIAQPLELGDYGFIAPSVNDEINNLIRQTDTIIDMIDDLKSNGE